jgi:hypothetical protein
MRRRGFLAVSALGTGVAAIGCGAASTHPTLAVSDARELAARLQRGMRMLEERPFGSMVQGAAETRPDLKEHLLRLTLESFLVLDALRSLPEGTAAPPELAEVLAPMLPRLDRCIHTHRSLLARMPVERRRSLDRRVRERPELAMDAAAWLDERAAEVGVPRDNRLRLRHSAMTVGTRLRRQSTNAVVDDCVAKLDEAFVGAAPLTPDLADATARVVDVMWRQVDEPFALPSPTVSPPPSPSVPSAPRDPLMVPERFGSPREMADPTEPVQWNDSWSQPGDEEIRIGAILMPFGLVTCGILLIVGIVVLASGEAQNGNWDGRTHADDATVR